MNNQSDDPLRNDPIIGTLRNVQEGLKMMRSGYSERGASMVEFAVVLPPLMLVLFGIIQYGFIFSAYMTVRNAAAVAARYAALTQNPAPTSSDVEGAARAAVSPVLDPARLSVAVDMNETLGGAAGGKRVTLTYQFPVFASFVVPGASGGQIPIHVSSIAR